MSTTTMLPNPLNTPGVYIQEIPVLPSSIVSVPTAIPVFVGYTEKAMETKPDDLKGVPFMIENMMEYQQFFGGPWPEQGIVANVDDSAATPVVVVTLNEKTRSPYLMYYSLQMYFANGGSSCYILSIAYYNAANPVILASDYKSPDGLFNSVLQKYNDITLVVCPDALSLPHSAASATADTGDQTYYQLQTSVIAHCVVMQNRLAVMDVYPVTGNLLPEQNIDALRNADQNNNGLQVPMPENYKFAAAYFPRLITNITPVIRDPGSTVDNDSYVNVFLASAPGASVKLNTLKTTQGQIYYAVKNYISNNMTMLLPAAPAIVGVYAAVDNALGVWNAPANVGLTNVVDLEQHISAQDQGKMNIDPYTGLSVNVIRSFPGRGAAIIWGARTLAGNDNEWRYISVRRFFFMVEQSVKNAIEPFVFATNDNGTWTRVKAMIGNYLTELWRQGALMGASPKDAFYVRVGLGETMSETDLWEGRMIVQIGMSVVRPAEFIILQFMQMMQTS